MIWKAAAEEKLTKYPMRLAAVQNLQEQLRLYSLEDLQSPQYADPRVSTTISGDKLLNALAKKQELEWSLEQTQCWIKVTERALDTLSEDDRQVLHFIYMDPEGGMEKLCSRSNKERTTIYRQRDRALRRFTMALYGS